MDYLFENLGEDRFQEFCQALLVNLFPDLQCLPVKQPDGGRDAIVYFDGSNEEEFIVFQVKYARQPTVNDDGHKWLLDVLKKEAPKLEKLIPRGAKKYYLLTNARGTAHLDTGSIDKVHEILSEAISIPAQCWWRADLNQRLDNHWDLKWSYPELLSGTNLMSYLIQSRLLEGGQDRMAAIKAFLRDQYEMDEEVRFKQVELQNRLLDLFVDVPITLRSHINRKQQRAYSSVLWDGVESRVAASGLTGLVAEQTYRMSPHMFFGESEVSVGAASVLLHKGFQDKIPQVVLEGAPGQGKSTIVQYVCQVHRMKMLNELEALSQVPESHRVTGVRIPFKVDLRDYATWLGAQDPFSSEENTDPPKDWNKSLEWFLAAQVRYHSGGLAFSADDLVAVAGVSKLLIVLDGLDEVADIPVREDVVKEVMAGVKRLKENATSVQVIVTSRPAAFANSPGFPEKTFPYFELGSIDDELINDYADKWMRARKLHGRREGAEVRKILKQKLDQPHLRDLAKNPMQLAILLSLILTRGSSLPDKRTALYDSYMGLFFDREAEKSTTVRKHRDLLIDIHRYLAWVLHSEAEKGHSRGSISGTELRHLLEKYLESEDKDPAIVEELFTGMVERVVALVSRLEGSYEFEVQPLREYFTARYLYDTAPYSPPGGEARGTLPDRFDAIARNFYWLNVTRFYAGCYSKGELPSLADRLQELCQDSEYRRLHHPRILAATLLADWVFAQHSRSMKEVVKLLLDGLGLRYVTSPRPGSRRTENDALVLPKECGGSQLVDRCFEILNTFPARDYALELVDLIKANSNNTERLSSWLAALNDKQGEQKTRWIEYGLYLGVLSGLSTSELESLLSSDGSHAKEILGVIFRANRVDFVEQSEKRLDLIVERILARDVSAQYGRREQSVLHLFARSLDPVDYDIMLRSPGNIPLSEIRRYVDSSPLDEDLPQFPMQFAVVRKCAEVIRVAQSQRKLSVREWSSTIGPWDKIVETSRSLFGERWAHFHLANVASGIRSRDEIGQDHPHLFDHSKSLCRRARYARLRAGNASWWERQLWVANGNDEKAFALLILLSWGSAKTLMSLTSPINDALISLPTNDWLRLARSLYLYTPTMWGLGISDKIRLDVEALPNGLADRTVSALEMRMNAGASRQLVSRYLSRYEGSDPVTLTLLQRTAADHILDQPSIDWKHWLRIIERSYNQDNPREQGLPQYYRDSSYYLRVRRGQVESLSPEVAQEIADAPAKYPRHLVAIAESRCRLDVSSEVVPVAEVAQRENWLNI